MFSQKQCILTFLLFKGVSCFCVCTKYYETVVFLFIFALLALHDFEFKNK